MSPRCIGGRLGFCRSAGGDAGEVMRVIGLRLLCPVPAYVMKDLQASAIGSPVARAQNVTTSPLSPVAKSRKACPSRVMLKDGFLSGRKGLRTGFCLSGFPG